MTFIPQLLAMMSDLEADELLQVEFNGKTKYLKEHDDTIEFLDSVKNGVNTVILRVVKYQQY